MTASGDLALLDAWRGGDRDAGSRLFDAHLESVSRFFRNKVDGSCEDLVQETFLACIESRDRFAGRSSFRTYLFSIARHVLFGHYRRDRTWKIDALTTSVTQLGCSAGSVLARTEERALLLRALRHLPLDFQVTLELAYWEGLEGSALAEVLDVSPHTVRSRISRAKSMLRHKITELADKPALGVSTIAHLERWAQRDDGG